MSPPESNSFMVFPMRLLRLFRAGKDILPRGQAAQEQAERLLAEAFRSLGTLCGRMADVLEAQRLSRSGYGPQGKFLERLDTPASPPRTRP
jgi:hypothetical protein